MPGHVLSSRYPTMHRMMYSIYVCILCCLDSERMVMARQGHFALHGSCWVRRLSTRTVDKLHIYLLYYLRYNFYP